MTLVYGLAKPHRIGSVCGNPCEQCGGGMLQMTGPGAMGLIEPIPLFILREATHQEYVASAKEHGSVGRLSDPAERFFYEVSCD